MFYIHVYIYIYIYIYICIHVPLEGRRLLSLSSSLTWGVPNATWHHRCHDVITVMIVIVIITMITTIFGSSQSGA